MSSSEAPPPPQLAGGLGNLRFDALAGVLVFLIALPLCLAIAKASGFPPIAGVFTAIAGGLFTPFISNAEMTIKGPAAGLIVIVLGCMQDFGFAADASAGDMLHAYRMTLAVGVAAGVIQILFGLFRVGILGEFFPTAAVHGLLAAIGVIIISKQYPIAIGAANTGEPLELLRNLPHKFLHELNPEIALIGSLGLLILFTLQFVRTPWVKRIPGPLVVLLVTVPLGMYFDLSHEHTYSYFGHEYMITPKFLVDVPQNVSQLIGSVQFPDWSALATTKGWWWVVMFSLIGSLESLLSAKAVELLDPWKRRTDFDRDLLAVGAANTFIALVGGLPMISEIVRSRANIDNGARTRWSNAIHGLFLLLFVAIFPGIIHQIPLAALASMLIFTGFRLASPREFVHVYNVGREQLVIFVTTIVAVLATDLLWGIVIGIAAKIFIHFLNGVPLFSLVTTSLDVEAIDDATVLIRAKNSAVFSNWILFKRRIESVGLLQGMNVIVDLSETQLVDHTVMEKLHEMQRDFTKNSLRLEIVGLDEHLTLSDHPFAARRKKVAKPTPEAPTSQVETP